MGRDGASDVDSRLWLAAYVCCVLGVSLLLDPLYTPLYTLSGTWAKCSYHNREVSYSSILDLSITARQRALYEQNGLDIEKWTEMGACPHLLACR